MSLYSPQTYRYKNAIVNELYLTIAAKLGEVEWAMQMWSWFVASGMINTDHGLVNDGLNDTSCLNNGGNTWT